MEADMDGDIMEVDMEGDIMEVWVLVMEPDGAPT